MCKIIFPGCTEIQKSEIQNFIVYLVETPSRDWGRENQKVHGPGPWARGSLTALGPRGARRGVPQCSRQRKFFCGRKSGCKNSQKGSESSIWWSSELCFSNQSFERFHGIPSILIFYILWYYYYDSIIVKKKSPNYEVVSYHIKLLLLNNDR